MFLLWGTYGYATRMNENEKLVERLPKCKKKYLIDIKFPLKKTGQFSFWLKTGQLPTMITIINI